jgi:hypothetical protein
MNHVRFAIKLKEASEPWLSNHAICQRRIIHSASGRRRSHSDFEVRQASVVLVLVEVRESSGEQLDRRLHSAGQWSKVFAID